MPEAVSYVNHFHFCESVSHSLKIGLVCNMIFINFVSHTVLLNLYYVIIKCSLYLCSSADVMNTHIELILISLCILSQSVVSKICVGAAEAAPFGYCRHFLACYWVGPARLQILPL